MLHENCGFGTKAIHAGNVKDSQYGALTTPIFQTSTFVFDSCEQGGRRLPEPRAAIFTPASATPPPPVLEAKIAVLENGEACVAASSGMGAPSPPRCGPWQPPESTSWRTAPCTAAPSRC